MNVEGRWVGAILVGGASRRMGAPKRSVRWRDGSTLEERVAAALLAAGATEVVRVGGSPDPATIADTRPGEGPLAAVEALLLARGADVHVVCPCDMPELPPTLVRDLLRGPAGDVAVFAVLGEAKPRPLPMRIAGAALPCVQRLLARGERSLRALLVEANAVTAPLSATEAEGLRDVDTPDDLVERPG